MTLYLNYLFMAIGIAIVIIALTLILLDKLKGEDLYFSIDMKEQELKKVLEDAEELVDELKYTSEMVISDMEKKYGDIKTNCEKLSSEARKHYEISKQSNIPVEKPNIVYSDQSLKQVTPKKASKLVNEEDESEKKKLTARQMAVIEMAARGMEVTEIAREMNMGQGEVSLILTLRNEE